MRYFKKEKKRFGDAVKIAIAVSKAAVGRKPEGNIVMASFVFTRMCIAADTLLYVLRRDIGNSKEQTLDHYSIGILSRNIIELALMFHYLSEDGVSRRRMGIADSNFQSTRFDAKGSPLEGTRIG